METQAEQDLCTFLHEVEDSERMKGVMSKYYQVVFMNKPAYRRAELIQGVKLNDLIDEFIVYPKDFIKDFDMYETNKLLRKKFNLKLNSYV
jgi:hypothetical protein